MEDMDNVELLKQMAQRLERIEKRQRRGRWWKTIVWCCVLAVLVGLAFYAGPKVIDTVQRYNAAMTRIEEVSAALDGVNAEKLKESLKFLETVDFDKLRVRADELGKLTEEFAKLNLEELNGKLDELQTALEPVLKFLK